MKAIVRDDIISLYNYVDAEFKYKKYIEIIQKSGNYCFLDQFKKLVPGGENIVRSMVESNLIATENLNKSYKYIYITDTAVKYLELRDSEKDFSTTKKNTISVKKVKKNPSQKQLFSSAFKFHLMINGEELLDKATILKSIEDMIFIKNHQGTKEDYLKWDIDMKTKISKMEDIIIRLRNELLIIENNKELLNKDTQLLEYQEDNKELTTYKKQLETVLGEIQEKEKKAFKTGLTELRHKEEILKLKIDGKERILQIKTTANRTYLDIIKDKKSDLEKAHIILTDYHKKVKNVKAVIASVTSIEVTAAQKIFENLYDISKNIARIKGNTLEFIILDTGNFKTAYGYLKQINSFLNLKIEIKDIKIIIYSYAEHRASNLLKELERVQRDKERAIETITSYNIKTNNSTVKSDSYVAARKIYDNTPDFTVEVKDDLYYMNKYIGVISSLDKSIKLKDRNVIDDLAAKFK